mgnify:CR=1 FL=1
MGYRSDVVAIFYATDKGGEEHREFNKRNRVKLKLFMEENFPKYWRGTGNELDDSLTMLDTPDRLIYEFKVSSVKWYEGYEDVTEFEQFWDKFKELADAEMDGDEPQGDEPVEWACEFIRLGENTEDIEEKSIGDSDWLLQVNRYIETNY